MPRRSRVVFPGVPHHLTQRGNHRERVFFEAGDEAAYLALLQAYSRRNGLEIYAYCLMPNHMHAVAVPLQADSLHLTMRTVHSQYAQRINRMRQINGHLWQGRFNSSPLDSNHFLNAIRYVEQNPVAAGLVRRAAEYPWSSAAAHCGLRFDPLLEPAEKSSLLNGIADWSVWLACAVPDDCRKALRLHARRNLPCGDADFVDELGRIAARDLRLLPRGGQPKTGK